MSGNGPRTIGNFAIERELGSGGMGVVLLGRHQSLDRPAVLKRLRPDLSASEDLVERFAREARSAASIHHQNVVAVYDWISWRGEHYIAQEYVDGVDLREALGHAQRFPWRLAALVALELARGLEAIHARGMVHRDLKPANVLLAAPADEVALNTLWGCPKITDFGLARRVEGDGGLTTTGAIMGTPSYMAPEQAEGRLKDLGPHTDVYALGAILYELLTGRPPFAGAEVGEVLRQVREAEPARPRQVWAGVPRALEAVCLRAQPEPLCQFLAWRVR
jgi:serine/threonine-protein kinase